MLAYLGIDWSEAKHDAVFHNEQGKMLCSLRIPHDLEGFKQLDEARQQIGVSAAECVVGLETAHTLLIDFLWEQGYSQIYVMPPNQINSNQGRHRQSGARTDPSDADLIAEVVRTDRHRLYPWHPGSPLLQQMRVTLANIRFLTQEKVRWENHLRSVLLRAYPAALHVFSGIDMQISLHFLQAYPTPQEAAQLDLEAFERFVRAHRYPPKRIVAAFARLQQPSYAPVPATTSQAYREKIRSLAEILLGMVRAKAEQLHHLQRLYEQHPDRPIFDSLPGAGALLAPGLLVKFGEDRQRFPSPQLVQALAGTAPVTKQSGKRRWVEFRIACDHEFRYLVAQWTRKTVNVSLWATSYYQRVRPTCRSEHEAYRRLGHRWIEVVWRMWQDHRLYDEGYKLRQQGLRSAPKR